MNRQEHLLTILAEECNEVAQRVSKALRFGLDEVQPGQDYTNADRLRQEIVDFAAAFAMVCTHTGIKPIDEDDLSECALKIAKVERFLEYSRECGTLTE